MGVQADRLQALLPRRAVRGADAAVSGEPRRPGPRSEDDHLEQHSYRIKEVWQRPGQLQVYSRGNANNPRLGNTNARGNAGNADARRRMAKDGRAQAWGKRISEAKIRKREEASARQRGPSDMPRVVETLTGAHARANLLASAWLQSVPIAGRRAHRNPRAEEMRQDLHESLKRGECNLRGIVRRARRLLQRSLGSDYLAKHWLSRSWVDEEVQSYDRLSLAERRGDKEEKRRRR